MILDDVPSSISFSLDGKRFLFIRSAAANSGGQSHLAAILHRKKLVTLKHQIRDSIRDGIHPGERIRKKRENEITREKSRSVELSKSFGFSWAYYGLIKPLQPCEA